MKITAIKSQVYAKNRFSIFTDGKYLFSVSEAALLDQGLQVGQELDATKIRKLKQVADADARYGQTLKFIMLRPRSEWEIRSYLKRKKSPALLVDQIVNKLTKSDLVDDLAFARAWVESRRLHRTSSKYKLQQELLLKHVSQEIVDQVLAEDDTDDLVALRILISKKRALSRYQDELKLMQYLVRQGFSYSDVKAALSEENVSNNSSS